MRREFSVVVARDEAGYLVGTVPGLHGCHTQARSLDELMGRVREAIAVCLANGNAQGPRREFVGVVRITVER